MNESTLKQKYLHDDGKFFIESNSTCENQESANVFLCVRCMPDLHTLGGFACVGGAANHGGTNWRADINQMPTDTTDCMTVYEGANRSAAISKLWASRHDAHISNNVRIY